jgi:hypothetical protein
MAYIINLDDQPELLCTAQTPTREVIERPGLIAAGSQLEFRGWLISDYNPDAAKSYANNHLDAIRGKREHMLAAVATATAVENQGVGVVAFGDLNKNRDKGRISKVFFPFRQGENVLRRELVAIRLAFEQGLFDITDRQDGLETVDSKPMEVKTFTVVTTNIDAVWAIRDYKNDRLPRQLKLCYKLETLLQDIAEVSDAIAKRKVAACVYYAPEGSTSPLILAAINVSFVREIQGF